MATKIEQEKPAGSLEPLELTSLRDDVRERPARSQRRFAVAVVASLATALAVAGAVEGLRRRGRSGPRARVRARRRVERGRGVRRRCTGRRSR